MSIKELYLGKKNNLGKREIMPYNIAAWLLTVIIIGWVVRKIFF